MRHALSAMIRRVGTPERLASGSTHLLDNLLRDTLFCIP